MTLCIFLLKGGPEVAGIFVKALQAGGAAAQDGRIQRGTSSYRLF